MARRGVKLWGLLAGALLAGGAAGCSASHARSDPDARALDDGRWDAPVEDAALDAPGSEIDGGWPLEGGADGSFIRDAGDGGTCPTEIPTTVCRRGIYQESQPHCLGLRPGYPCGFWPTSTACTTDGDCGEGRICHLERCFFVDTANDAGCEALDIAFRYGGGGSHDIYTVELDVTPALEAEDGAPIVCAHGMEGDNDLPFPSFDSFESHFEAAVLTYDGAGFHATAGSSFSVRRLRGPYPSLGDRWSRTADPILTYSAEAGSSAETPSSELTVTVWSTDGICSTRALYHADPIAPGTQHAQIALTPAITTICP